MDIFPFLLLDVTGANPVFSSLPGQAQWFIALWLFVFGACAGSFMNVVIYRVPAGLSVVNPGSRCPICKHEIRWFDNIPVLSWLVLGARCRSCKAPIAIRYPFVSIRVRASKFILEVIDRTCT